MNFYPLRDISTTSFTFFENLILKPLNTIQKRVAIIALAVFCGLASAALVYRYCFYAKKSESIASDHNENDIQQNNLSKNDQIEEEDILIKDNQKSQKTFGPLTKKEYLGTGICNSISQAKEFTTKNQGPFLLVHSSAEGIMNKLVGRKIEYLRQSGVFDEHQGYLISFSPTVRFDIDEITRSKLETLKKQGIDYGVIILRGGSRAQHITIDEPHLNIYIEGEKITRIDECDFRDCRYYELARTVLADIK